MEAFAFRRRKGTTCISKANIDKFRRPLSAERVCNTLCIEKIVFESYRVAQLKLNLNSSLSTEKVKVEYENLENVDNSGDSNERSRELTDLWKAVSSVWLK